MNYPKVLKIYIQIKLILNPNRSSKNDMLLHRLYTFSKAYSFTSISFIWSLKSFDQQPNQQSLFISGSFNVRKSSMPLIARIDYISTLNLHSKNHLNSKRHLSHSPGGEELVKLTVTLNKWLQKNLILLDLSGIIEQRCVSMETFIISWLVYICVLNQKNLLVKWMFFDI